MNESMEYFIVLQNPRAASAFEWLLHERIRIGRSIGQSGNVLQIRVEWNIESENQLNIKKKVIA